jgi:putative ABC transport system permease protein
MLLSTLVQRQREIAVMRAMGAHASFVFLLVEIEAVLITGLGVLLGAGALSLVMSLSADWLSASYGLFLESSIVNEAMLQFAGVILVSAVLLALLPAVLAYRSSLVRALSARA